MRFKLLEPPVLNKDLPDLGLKRGRDETELIEVTRVDRECAAKRRCDAEEAGRRSALSGAGAARLCAERPAGDAMQEIACRLMPA